MTWIPDVLDIYFAAYANGERDITNQATWRASLLGTCLRRQYLELYEKVPTPPNSADTGKIFALGHAIEGVMSKAFHTLGVLQYEEAEFHDKEWDLGAHADFIVGGKVAPVTDDHDPMTEAVRTVLVKNYGDQLPLIGVELKTKGSRGWRWAKKKSEPQASDAQLIQAGAYGLLAGDLGIEQWVVLSALKDNLEFYETPVLSQHSDEAKGRIEMLNEAKDKGALTLPCDCLTKWNGKGWKYCPYGVNETTCCLG